MTTRVRAWWFPALAAAVVAVSVVWGWRIQADPNVELGAAPLVGRWHVRFGPSLLAAGALAAATVWWGPGLAERLRFRRLVVGSALAAIVFTLVLAASDGRAHVLDPVVQPTEYWANLATLPPAGAMLHRYGTVKFLLQYSVHAKGHPPGLLLLLKALAALGLGHPWTAGALSYLGVGLVVIGVTGTIWAVAGEDAARRSAPWLVVAPFAVWSGTSADAFYAGVGAMGVFLTVAATRRHRLALVGITAFAAGLVLGALLFFTYGAAVFLLVPATLASALLVPRRRWRSLLVLGACGAAGVATVVLAFRLAGFWWFDGLAVTRWFYWTGTAHFRPAGYFAVANLGAACIALGPAVIVGTSRLRDRRLWLVVGAGAACILAADVSQYSKAEVERIWLLFYPWLVPAAVALRRPRPWLGAQAALTIGLQVALVSQW